MKKALLSGAVALTLIAAAAPMASANDWRDNPGAQWDAAKHNGYWWHNKWHYGQPPASYRGSDLRVGWHDWRRGDRIPAGERTRYAEVDWRAHHLRHPPRGYHWVQDDRGNFILAAVATGLITDLIINSH